MHHRFHLCTQHQQGGHRRRVTPAPPPYRVSCAQRAGVARWRARQRLVALPATRAATAEARPHSPPWPPPAHPTPHPARACARPSAAAALAKLFVGKERVGLGGADVDNRRAPVPVLLQRHARRAVVGVRDARRAACDAPRRQAAGGALVADADDGGGACVRVAYDALSITCRGGRGFKGNESGGGERGATVAISNRGDSEARHKGNRATTKRVGWTAQQGRSRPS